MSADRWSGPDLVLGLGQGAMETGGRVPGEISSDEELMRRLAAGDHDALGPLHGRYVSQVFNLAAQTLDRAAAEDIVQDVFVTVWRKAGTFDPARGTFRAWVLRITHVRVLNELRRRGRRLRVEPDPDGLRLGDAPEPGPGPDEQAWRDHRRAIVRAAVEALPPPQRQALRLAFLDDLSHRQIAEFLDLPLGTAKTRIRAGLRTLRGYLAPLVAAGLISAGVVATLLVHEQRMRSSLRRDESALRIVTSSDVAPLRLVATPGPASGIHGNYRGRPGTAMAVITFSQFPATPAGQVYRAWGMYEGRWYLLGTVRPDVRGHDLLVVEGPHLTALPSILQVTLERTTPATVPNGTPVIVWPSR